MDLAALIVRIEQAGQLHGLSWQLVQTGERISLVDGREGYIELQWRDPLLVGRVWGSLEATLIQAAAQSCGVATVIDCHPFAEVNPAWAVVNVPIADIFVQPQPPWEGPNLATQARLGAVVALLRWQGDQALVRLDSDGYIGWIHASDVTLLTGTDWAAWTTRPQVLLCHSGDFGDQDCRQRLYAGTLLPLLAHTPSVLTLGLPSGQALGIPATQGRVLGDRPSMTADQILATARRFLPGGDEAVQSYLWGGTAGSRLDCSGFVQTIGRLGGIMLPRDADQQQRFCQPIAPEETQPGDLIFFSEDKVDITHVGICLDHERFIHCSPRGAYSGVKINALNGETEYEKTLCSLFWGIGRWI